MEIREKIVGRGVWLEGGEGGNFGGALEFSLLAHQNTIYSNWGENARENCAKLFGQKCPFKPIVCMCLPLFPIPFKKKKKKTRRGRGLCF